MLEVFEDVSLEDPTPEISRFLFHLLLAQRKDFNPGIFNKDPQMARRVGRYENDLTQFLHEPKILALGDDMRKRQMWFDVITQAHKKDTTKLEEEHDLYFNRRKQLTDSLDQTDLRIKNIGSGGVLEGDLKLLRGRIQVYLFNLQSRGRLSWLGRLTTRIFTPLPVHPATEGLTQALQQNQDDLSEVSSHTKQINEAYGANSMEQKTHFYSQQRSLYYQLDQWAILDDDRFIVNYLYYGSPSLELFLRRRQLDQVQGLQVLDIFRRLELVTKAEYDEYQVAIESQALKAIPETSATDPTLGSTDHLLPYNLIVDGQIITDTEFARQKIFSLPGASSLSERRKRQIFDKLVQALKYESMGSHHPDSLLLKGEDMQQRVGGNWRLQIGRLRLIGIHQEEGSQAVEVVRILQRDDPKYY